MSDSFLTLFSDDFHITEIKNRFGESYTVSPQLVNLLATIHRDVELYDSADFEKFNLTEIFDYLKASHIYYLDSWLPKINHSVYQLRSTDSCNYFAVELLSLFLEKYQRELEKHIAYEEQVLFDFVREILRGNYSSKKKDFVLHHFLFTHNDNVIVHLTELKDDLMKFDAGLKNNFAFQVLFTQLEIFQNDLLIHGLIEDEVFIPKLLTYINTHFEGLEIL